MVFMQNTNICTNKSTNILDFLWDNWTCKQTLPKCVDKNEVGTLFKTNCSFHVRKKMSISETAAVLSKVMTNIIHDGSKKMNSTHRTNLLKFGMYGIIRSYTHDDGYCESPSTLHILLSCVHGNRCQEEALLGLYLHMYST